MPISGKCQKKFFYLRKCQRGKEIDLPNLNCFQRKYKIVDNENIVYLDEHGTGISSLAQFMPN